MSESPSVAPLVGDIGSITQSMLDRWGLFSLLDAELLNRVAFAFVYGANGNEAVLVTGDDCVYCIGNGTAGPGIISEAHLNVPGGLSVQLDALCGCRVVELASGSGPHLLALTDSGDLYTWGSNSHCQLGNGNTNQLLQPTLSSLLKVCSIACGASHSLALTQDGEVYAWGCNNCGQVGSGTTVNQPSPRRLAGPLTNRRIRRVGACQSASFAVSVAGEVFSWGCNKHGQLGIGGASGANQNVPVRLTSLERRFIDSLACGQSHTGLVLAWGLCRGQPVSAPIVTRFLSVNDVFACMSHPPVTCKRLDFKPNYTVSIAQSIQLAFNDSATSDVTFQVDGKLIHAHKSILRIRCDHFRTMFNENWNQTQSAGVIAIRDFSYPVYWAFLEFLYTDNVNLSPEEAISLLDLANCYCEAPLKAHCERLIKNSITIDNAMMLYLAAVKFSASELQKFCFEFAIHHLTRVVSTEAFDELDEATLRSFLRQAAAAGAFKY
uniref:BTB domain-containing protein n=1 Tax=Macrostomum lignano TaxID=282301 RepID=A0A1I8HSR5_9PLAT